MGCRTTDAPLPVWGTRQGIGFSDRGGPGLAPPGYDLSPLRGSNQAPRRLVRAVVSQPARPCDRKYPSPLTVGALLEISGRPNGGAEQPQGVARGDEVKSGWLMDGDGPRWPATSQGCRPLVCGDSSESESWFDFSPTSPKARLQTTMSPWDSPRYLAVF